MFREKYQTGLDTLLQESEKRMYADKAAYYKRTGIDRRKYHFLFVKYFFYIFIFSFIKRAKEKVPSEDRTF